MKYRLTFIITLITIALALSSWRIVRQTYGQSATDRTYDSPAGQFTLPTVDGTAGTVSADNTTGSNYRLASLAFGFASRVPQVGNLAGDTGNGFSDRYDFENLDAFSIPQSANNIGDLDSQDPRNAVLVGGRLINPGFRFVHIGLQPFVWRAGGANDNTLAAEVIVFPSLDHIFDPEIPGYGPNRQNPPAGGLGNVVLEATEFTVFGTDDAAEAELAARTPGYFGRGGTGDLPANGKWVRASLTKVFADGFKDYNGSSPFTPAAEGANPSPQEGEDFATLWRFPKVNGQQVRVKYIAVHANRTRDERFFRPDAQGKIPGRLAESNEAEIDAVAFREASSDEPPPTPTPTRTPGQTVISGRVINDLNANGRVDSGEPPIPGVTVRLSGPIAREAITDVHGDFLFRELVAGDYRLTETNLPEFIDSGAIAGTGITAVVDANNITVKLAAEEHSANNIFLDTKPPTTCTPACYNSADMWLLYDGARRNVYNSLGGVGAVFIPSLNRGARSDEEVVAALDGLFTAKQLLEREIVAAQLNAAAYPRSIFNRASCFYLGPNVILRIPGDPRLIDVLNQARAAFAANDEPAIMRLLVWLANFNNVTATTGILCPFADP